MNQDKLLIIWHVANFAHYLMKTLHGQKHVDHHIHMCLLNIPFQSWPPLCCCNSLYSLGRLYSLFWRVVMAICLFSHKSIIEVGHWCSGVDVRALCSLHKFFHTKSGKPWLHRACLCAQGHCHSGTGLSPLVPAKGNYKYKYVRCNCVLPLLWQQFAEGPHMGVSNIWPYSVPSFSYLYLWFKPVTHTFALQCIITLHVP